MTLNQTPSAERIHIGIFGKRNAGKSSLINALAGQPVSIVSDFKGTTTDPVKKAMELLPLGPVVLTDTPGLDDTGELGTLRIEKTQQILNTTDIALLVIDGQLGITEEDTRILQQIRQKQIPFVIAVNKMDLTIASPVLPDEISREQILYVSAAAGTHIHELKELIAKQLGQTPKTRKIVGDLIHPGDFVVLVIPIDKAAPKGRLILPQQQTIRDILDHGATAIAREEFFEKLSETVNTLKLRGSWGQLGNTSSNYNSFWDWYPFYQQQAISSASSNWLINGEKQNTSSLPSIVNATMTWETVETWDFGFDFGAFNNRLTGTFDWYSRTTKDMIGPAPILGSVLGTNAPKTNNCDMRTSGWELEIGWRDQINDFKYGVRFNLSDNRSKILTYPYDGEFSNQSIGGYYNGKYLNEIWGYESVGLASSKVEMDNWLTTNKPNWGSNWGAGDVMYKDLNGDGIVSSGANTLDDHGDLKRIGNATPRYRIGLNLDAAYKGFDFSIFFQGVLKRDWFFGAGDAYFWGAQGNMWQSACFEDHLDYWTENNTGAYYPKPYFGGIQKNQQTQTRYLQSAAYLRCKNIQLGYTLPKSLLSPAGISNCRIYLSCDNLFTITSLSDIFDPEAFGGYGDEGWGSGKTYPLQRTVSVGVNLSF